MPKTKRPHSDDWGSSLDDADSEPSSDADCSRTGRSRRRCHSEASKKEGKRRLPAVCQVKGCQADLFAIGKRYCLRKRVCPDHLVARQVELADSDYPGIHRFCHQCGKFEPAESFDEGKRSCRARLLKRRFNQQANRLAKKKRQATVLGQTAAPLRSRASTRPHVQQLIETEAQQWPQLIAAGPGAPQAASELDPSLLQRLSSTSSSWTSGSMEQLQAPDDGAAACGLVLPDGLAATGALQLQLEAAAAAAGGRAPTAADAAAAVAAAAGLLPFCALAAEPTIEELQFEDELEQLICCQLASVSSGQQQQQDAGTAIPVPAGPEAALAEPAAAAAAVAEGPEVPAVEEDPATAAAARAQPASPNGTSTPTASSSGHGCSSGSKGSPLSQGQGLPVPGVAATAGAPPGGRACASVGTVPASLPRSGGSSSHGDGGRSTATAADAGALASSISAMLEPSASAVRWPSAEKQALLEQLMELMYEDATSPGAPVGAAVAAAAAAPWAPVGSSGGLPALPDPILPDLATVQQAAGMGWQQSLLGRQSSGLGAGACSSVASPDAVAAALGSSAGSASAGVAAMLHPATCPPAFCPEHGRYVVQMMPVLARLDEGSEGLPLAAANPAAWPAATTPLPMPLPAVPAASAGLPPASRSSTGLAQRRRDQAGSQPRHSASAGSSGFSSGDRAPAAAGSQQLQHLRRLGVLHRRFCDVSSRLAQLQSLVTAETQAAVAAAAAGLSATPTPTASSPREQLLSASSSAASTEFALQLLQSQAQGGVAGGRAPAPPMWL